MLDIRRVLVTSALIISSVAITYSATRHLISNQMKLAKSKVVAFSKEVSLGSSSSNLATIAMKHNLRYQWNPGNSEPTPRDFPTSSGSFLAYSEFTISSWQCVVSFENGLVRYKSEVTTPD